jgi:hypothetical protein
MKIKLITLIAIIAVLIVVGLILYFDVFGLFKIKRPDYCDEYGCVPEEVFRKLPDYPRDFEDVKKHIMSLETTKREYSEEYYYQQPEFYGNSFIEEGLSYYTKLSKPRNFTYMNVMGYGVYPSDVKIEIDKEYDFITYLHTSWGVVKYQGLSLDVVYPENSDITEECFDVLITPSTFLLGRTYLSFDPDWTKKVKINIKASEDCPKGDYFIGITPINVPKEFENEWLKLYGNGYMSLGMVGLGRPLIQIYVEKI